MITIVGYIALTLVGLYLLRLGFVMLKITIGFGGGKQDKIMSMIILIVGVLIFIYLLRHVHISFIPD
jgi:hypothetical protein